MAKMIDYLEIAIGSISSFTKELIVQLNDKVEDIIVTGALLLLLSSFIYLLFCYLIANLSEAPRPGQRVRKNYPKIFMRTIVWTIFSTTLGVIYCTIVIAVAPDYKLLVYGACSMLFIIIVGYGASFAIPPHYI